MKVIFDQVANIIFADFDYYSPSASLISTLENGIKKADSTLSSLEISELLTKKNILKFNSALISKSDMKRKEGVFAPYEMYPDNNEIIGFSHPRPNDSPYMAKLRLVAPEIPKALNCIKKLSPKQFEQFCTKILALLEAEESMQTQYSKDGGVDFIGWLKLPDSLQHTGNMPKSIRSFRCDLRMLALGQAKRYKGTVGVDFIRELVGTVATFQYDQLAPWASKFQVPSLALMSPILPMIFTTGNISRDARELGRKCGVVTRDGVELAIFICLEDVAIDYSTSNQICKSKFTVTKFNKWLNSK
jgi:hypothetical protein